MFCIAAFVVLSILGIFSATNRELAQEASACVWRRLTLRPCTTGFREKMKAKIVGKLLTRSAAAARFVNRHFGAIFESLSAIFVVLSIVSLFWAGRGLYNFFFYGSCNGLNSSAFCAFDPKGENNQVTQVSASCGLTNPTEADLTLSGVDLRGFPQRGQTGGNELVFIGCYTCDYSRKAYPEIAKLAARSGVHFTFVHFPIKPEMDYLSVVDHCAYQADPDKFWDLNARLFALDKAKLLDPENVYPVLTAAGYDAAKIKACVNDQPTKDLVNNQILEVGKTHLYGTPTVFINGQALVGPKPYRVYNLMLVKGWLWLQVAPLYEQVMQKF